MAGELTTGGLARGLGVTLDLGWSVIARLGPDLLAYWDAVFPETMTIDGNGKVSAWTDKMSGLVASQPNSGLRPLYSSVGFGGDPTVAFSGVEFLSFDSTILPTGAEPCELWALVQQDSPSSDSTARYPIAYGSGNANGSRRLRRGVSGGNRGSIAVGTGGASVTVVEATQDLTGRHFMRGIVGATSSIAEVDGVQSAPSAAIPATSGTRGAIGATDNATPGNQWIGMISAILVTKPLSASKEAWLRDYLG